MKSRLGFIYHFLLGLVFSLVFVISKSALAEVQKGEEVFDHPIVAHSAQPALESIQTHLASVSSLRAAFSQTKKIAALTRPLTSKGEFLFSRGKGAIWKLRSPYESLFVVTPSSVRQSDAAGELSNLQASEQPVLRGFTEVFLGLLTGDVEKLEKQFQVYFVGDPSNWTMGLIGRDSRLRLFIDRIVLSGEKVVRRVQIFEKSGDSTSIDFSKVLTDGVQLSPDEVTLLAG